MEIPVSPSDLDSIIYNIARDLIEERAINGSIDGVTEETTREVVNDVVFIVERYMYYINSLMDTARLNKAKELFENQKDFE
jgi:hypothetical protein